MKGRIPGVTSFLDYVYIHRRILRHPVVRGDKSWGNCQMELEVRSAHEVEMEVRFRRIQSGTLEAVQQNDELLQKLAALNDELSQSETTMSLLEGEIELVRRESMRVSALMEESLAMSWDLQSTETSTDIKEFEREIWRLERECRLLSSPSLSAHSPPSLRIQAATLPPTPDLRSEIISTKEQLAELKRQIDYITQSPVSSPTFPRSREVTEEHHHHHYYYVPETPLNPSLKIQETPNHAKFFRELPTPPATASSVSSFSTRLNRFSSSFSTWLSDTNDEATSPDQKRISDTTINSSISNLSSNDTPNLKRSTSHESIFNSSPLSHRPSQQFLSTHSPPVSSSVTSPTSSPTYFSASAYLRQNKTSSLLLLSSERGKRVRGLTQRRSFWNIWDKSSPKTGYRTSSLRNVSSPTDLESRMVICTEVDVGMLKDALEG